ncbi:hypothetical protein QFZ53_002823 [Microbacterium natoriense]|uniref:Uncharacterized protein n=1 Tax=Microbacterium natoriense TaxID=284570 RepID=A0AAW8F055_9MICO|nr:DUF6507 family protein [Microbacterium natoriense]MDQ0648627.1 hypothetical protein [Microbacterium natoriense]
MTGWQLQPAGINTTIVTTDEKIQGFATAMTGLDVSVGEPLASGAGFDGIVATAVFGFLDEQSTGRLSTVVASCQNTMTCTADAANAFVQGDEQMAATLVAAADDTTTPSF